MTLGVAYSVRVAGSVFQVLGLFLTGWRIYIRLMIRRFWWEDVFAVALLFIGSLWLTSEWIFLLTNHLTSTINSWIYFLSFTCIVTLVRMSILFSIIRIIHENSRMLKFAYACVAYYAASWVILIVVKVVQCTSEASWNHRKVVGGKPFCRVKPPISAFQFTILILVVLPLRMLWRVKLPRRQRRMILSIFASSVLLAFGSLFHAVGQILNMFVMIVAGINVQVALSLVVCNLLVVVTYAYRFLYRDRDAASDTPESYDDDFTTRFTWPRPGTVCSQLTTVDLENAFDHQSAQTTESACDSTEGFGDISP